MSRRPRRSSRRSSRRLLAVLLLLGTWGAAVVAAAAPALAHAQMTSTDPVDGTRLADAPERVSVTFSEGVSFDAGFLKVVDSKGKQVDTGRPENPNGDNRVLSVGLRPGLPDDSYILSWRVVSPDSHPINGAAAFVVGSGPLVSASGAVIGGTTDRLVQELFTATRWVSFAGVVLLGGLVFVVLCWPPGRESRRARRVIWTGWAATTAGTVFALLLEGPYAAGTGIADALSADLLSVTVGTTFGRMLCARLVLLGVLAVLAARVLRTDDDQPEQVRARDEDIAAIVGLGILATFGGTGHAVAGNQPTLALLSDTVHLAAVSVWIGGLVMLVGCLFPTRRTDHLAATLPKFSRIAFGSVTVLVTTGSYQLWREVGTVPAMWSTDYGQLLLAKLTGFVLLVSLGYLGRRGVRRRFGVPVAYAMAAGDGGGVAAADDVDGDEAGEEASQQLLRRLRASVGAEVGVAAVILAFTAVLVSQAPARSSYVEPAEVTRPLGSGGKVEFSVTPARAGTNTVRVYLTGADGEALASREVTLTAELPAERIGPLPVMLVRAGPGEYQSTSTSFPRPGSWRLVVRVRTDEFTRSVVEAELPVR